VLPPVLAAQVRVVAGELDDRAELHGAAILARDNQFGREAFPRPSPRSSAAPAAV
jgi:hypothetical protein